MPNTAKRKRIRTSAPDEQIEQWEKEAEKMDVTRAEYMRLMMQAGRRQFDVCETSSGQSEGIDIENRVLDALAENGELTWEQLIDAAVGDVEDKVEDTIEKLDDEGKVSISFRDNTVSLR